MRARARVAACVAAFGLTVAPRVAEAAPVLDLEWPKLPGCPEASVVRARARAAIDGSKDVDDVRAVAEITPPAREGGAWQLHLRTRTTRAAGDRTVEAPTCDAIAKTAALLVAIAALRTRPPETEHPIDELVPAPAQVASSAPFAPIPLPRRTSETDSSTRAHRDRAGLVIGAGIGFVHGLLPSLAPAASITIGYEARWLFARLGARTLWPQEQFDRAVGAEFTAVGATLDVCARLPLSLPIRGKPHACAGAALDAVRASGIGGIEAFDALRAVSTAYGGAGAVWSVSNTVWLGADVRVGASLARPAFLIDSIADGQRPLHRVAALRTEGTVTIGLTF